MAIKKLIEVALPLEAINKEAAYEKMPGIGPHPRGLHLWWARRPFTAARAVIWASLVDDPSSHPDQFPTEEDQNTERERLFKILSNLVAWKNSNNADILEEAKAEIMKSTNGNPPALLDPFAGGGAIPLEAQRLGLEAHAHDLNPVAVMINKAMIEIPPKFAGQPPIHPGKSDLDDGRGWSGAAGLAEDVRYYGEWMKQEAYKRIGHLYPKVKDERGKEYTVVTWLWARTIKCPNPACECEMPLVKSFILAKKKGKQVWVNPLFENGKATYTIHSDNDLNVQNGTIGRKGAVCPCCGTPVEFSYIREEGRLGLISARLIAIVAEGERGRLYLSPTIEQEQTANMEMPKMAPDGEMPTQALGFRTQAYGINEYKKLFTNRQLTALTTFSDLVVEAQSKVISDGGSEEYGQMVGVYLAFAVDRLADFSTSVSRWSPTNEKPMNCFNKQTISMTWDYPEANPMSNSVGSFSTIIDYIAQCIVQLPTVKECGYSRQFDAQSDCELRNVMVSTDPPYYDNISYADLSDFFYIWMRQSLKGTYPDLFRTMLVPKAEELIATPYRFDGSIEKAREFFEHGMLQACKQIYQYAHEDIPVTIYYAYKQSEADGSDSQIASTGWETMLSAIIQAGFSITGTWPMRTEQISRSRGMDSNALASSIVLVCRKRPIDAPMCTRRDFINTLKRELKPALAKLQASNIAPVDLAQSAIGPGIGVYSRYSKVLEADGAPMSVRSALQIINQELDLYFNEQDSELDKESRFCVELYTQYAFNDIKFGEADVLARAKNTSVDKLRADGVLYSEKGVVHLLTRGEIPMEANKGKGIWLLTQQLTHAMETDGVMGASKIVKEFFTSEPERAKALAYRLFTLAERRGWAAEAYAYNSLIVAWPDVQSKAAELSAAWNNAEQQTLFSSGEISSGEV